MNQSNNSKHTNSETQIYENSSNNLSRPQSQNTKNQEDITSRSHNVTRSTYDEKKRENTIDILEEFPFSI